MNVRWVFGRTWLRRLCSRTCSHVYGTALFFLSTVYLFCTATTDIALAIVLQDMAPIISISISHM